MHLLCVNASDTSGRRITTNAFCVKKHMTSQWRGRHNAIVVFSDATHASAVDPIANCASRCADLARDLLYGLASAIIGDGSELRGGTVARH